MQNKSTTRSFRYIFFIYVSVIIGFAFLYMIPLFNTGRLAFIDSLFLSASGLSVTGLSAINISQELTRSGQALLMLEMQLGGMGIMVIMSYLFLLMGKKISVSGMMLLIRDQNQDNLKTIQILSLSVLVISLIIETICFAFIYSHIHKHFTNGFDAVFVAAFHSVASFTNAGFSLIDLQLFAKEPLFLLATALTIFLGSIGFPTIMEMVFSFKKKKSLFTKININMHVLLLAIGTVLYLLLEFRHAFASFTITEKLANALFLSATARSGGLAVFDISSLGMTTLLILMCFMFIGGASSSTGGGIRLTTFRVIIAKIVSVVRMNGQVIIGKRAVTQESVNKSFLIFFSFVTLTIGATILLTLFQTEEVFLLAFEVLSALANTGLSLGITSELTAASKLVLIFLMIVGRIGIFSLIYLVFKAKPSKVQFLEEDIAVG